MRALPGVTSAKVNFGAREVVATVQGDGVTAASLAEQLNAAGGRFRYTPR
ncbi:MAG: heavy-metal-associated domain-containing protein [Planctomycetes bacterium]|nr:heavy-metal-associated domain-containing protein [Planctomycetota bacterium]